MISLFTARPWPAKISDLSVLNYGGWSVCLAELERVPPNPLEDLKETVEALADFLEEEKVSVASVLQMRAMIFQHIKVAAVEVSMGKV